MSPATVMGPLFGDFCHAHGLWREFCDQVTVGDCWRSRAVGRAGAACQTLIPSPRCLVDSSITIRTMTGEDLSLLALATLNVGALNLAGLLFKRLNNAA